MLIKSADDKGKCLALRQDLYQSLVPDSATRFLCDRGYALKLRDHCSVTLKPSWFNPCQPKSAIF